MPCSETCGAGWSAGAELRAVKFYFKFFFFAFAFAVGGLGFEFCVFVASWRSECFSE